MTSTQAYDDPQRGAGLLIFAVAIMALAGTWAVIEGIVAGSKVYTANATFVFSDLNTWGWIVLLLGVLLLLAAFTVFNGSQFAVGSGSWRRASTLWVNSCSSRLTRSGLCACSQRASS